MDGIGADSTGSSVALTVGTRPRIHGVDARATAVSALGGAVEATPLGRIEDILELSPEGLAKSREEALGVDPLEEEVETKPGALTEEEEQEVAALRQRDAEVRRHEAAHSAAAGQFANGGPSFEFTTGPNGQRFATGGEVSIDVGPAATPEATLAKARIVRRAALAPADPSPADRQVAAQASRLETQARREIAEERVEKVAGAGEEGVGLGTSASDVLVPSAFGEPLATKFAPVAPQRLDVQV